MNKQEFEGYLLNNFSKVADPDFLPCVKKLYNNCFVDIPSLLKKLELVKKNIKEIENAKDLIVEFKAAQEFLGIPVLNHIYFGENPDLHLEIGPIKLAIEVKRFRYREKDTMDQEILSTSIEKGHLAEYGDPARVQEQIESVLIKKAIKYSGTEQFFLYLWSNSPHQVENVEILCASRNVFSKMKLSNLIGIFFKTNSNNRNLILSSQVSTDNSVVNCFKDWFREFR